MSSSSQTFIKKFTLSPHHHCNYFPLTTTTITNRQSLVIGAWLKWVPVIRSVGHRVSQSAWPGTSTLLPLTLHHTLHWELMLWPLPGVFIFKNKKKTLYSVTSKTSGYISVFFPAALVNCTCCSCLMKESIHILPRGWRSHKSSLPCEFVTHNSDLIFRLWQGAGGGGGDDQGSVWDG